MFYKTQGVQIIVQMLNSLVNMNICKQTDSRNERQTLRGFLWHSSCFLRVLLTAAASLFNFFFLPFLLTLISGKHNLNNPHLNEDSR